MKGLEISMYKVYDLPKEMNEDIQRLVDMIFTLRKQILLEELWQTLQWEE